jgi:hypothetical protein
MRIAGRALARRRARILALAAAAVAAHSSSADSFSLSPVVVKPACRVLHVALRTPLQLSSLRIKYI